MTADHVTRWVDYAVLWGANAVLAATLVTAVALAAAACARRTPALRYGLLCSCLATLAATPALVLLTQATGYSLWSWESGARTSPSLAMEAIALPSDPERAAQGIIPRTEATVAATNAISTLPPPLPNNTIAATPSDRSIEAATRAASSPSAGHASLRPRSERHAATARRPAPWFVALWPAGALIGLVRLASACRRLHALVRDARPASDDAAMILAECRRQLGIERDVALVVSDRIASPFAAGLRSACIVLPAAWAARASRDQLRTVLLHEAAHVVRRDPAIVLVQQLAAAFYWFHPLVRLFNARLAEAREETCDNYVLAAIDAPTYSRTLLTLAELIQPLRPLPATAGLFASRWRLERRIAGLLDERRDRTTRLAPRSKAIVGMLALAATVGAALAAGTLARGQTPDQDAAAPAPDTDESAIDPAEDARSAEALARAAAAAELTMQSIETAHIRYRRTLMSGPFKPGVTRERCLELLTKYDLATHPDSFRDLLVEILATETVAAAPWSEMELHTAHPGTATAMVRETQHSPNRDPDVHVVTPDVSLRWDEANSQLNVDAPRDNRIGYMRLSDLWRATPPALAGAAGVSIAHDNVGGRPALRVARNGGTILIDAKTGFYLSDDDSHNDHSFLNRWLGWRPTAGGAPFPTAVVDLKFTGDQLRSIGAYLVDEVQVNAPLSPATFVLGAPAGAVVVDSRGGEKRVVRINRDVFDASSPEQVNDATKPLKQEPTPTELAAFADLRRMYILADGEALRRLGPPYPLSRKYLMRMLSPSSAAERRGTTSAVINWKDGQLGDLRYFYAGFAPQLEHLLLQFLNQPPADIDIPDDVLGVELPGDYLVRPGATRDDLAAALSTIASQELGRSIRLQFQDLEREVYVARGTLTLDGSKLGKYSDLPLIAVNGGDYAGDHGQIIGFGNLAKLLNELSEYIDVKILDETTASDRELAWSKRWYDRDSTPADQRFRLDPQTVLDLVSQQTGVTFERQTRTVNVLNLAKP